MINTFYYGSDEEEEYQEYLKTNYGDFDDFLEYRFKINNHLLEKDK